MSRNGLVIASLWLILAGWPVAAQESPPPAEEETKATAPAPEGAEEEAPVEGTVWDFKVEEDGIIIARGDAFSMTAHVLLEAEIDRTRLYQDYNGPLYHWINGKDSVTQEPNLIPDRRSTTGPIEYDFSIPRARLALVGHAFAPWVNYRFEGDIGDWDPELLDAYVRLGKEEGAAGYIGQFRAPFDLFALSVPELLFPDTSEIVEALDPFYEPGLMFEGRFLDRQLVTTLALQDSGAEGSDRISGDDGDVQTTVRVEWQSKGGFEYDLTGIERPPETQFTVGVAYLSDFNGGEIDSDTGLFCLADLSDECEEKPYSASGWEVFLAVRGSAVAFAASYQTLDWKNARVWSNQPLPEAPNSIPADELKTYREDLTLQAGQVELGVFVAPNLQVVGRWSLGWTTDPTLAPLPYGPPALSPDDPGEPVSDYPRPDYVQLEESYSQWGFGVNYYFKKYNMKLLAGWNMRNVQDDVKDLYYSYVPSNVGGIEYSDYKRREGSIVRENTIWYALFSFAL